MPAWSSVLAWPASPSTRNSDEPPKCESIIPGEAHATTLCRARWSAVCTRVFAEVCLDLVQEPGYVLRRPERRWAGDLCSPVLQSQQGDPLLRSSAELRHDGHSPIAFWERKALVELAAGSAARCYPAGSSMEFRGLLRQSIQRFGFGRFPEYTRQYPACQPGPWNVDYPRLTGPGQSWFNPLAFAPVNTVAFGTAGFNTLRGPGTINLDASIFRDFSTTERIKVQFRFDMFNTTNTPHFNNPCGQRLEHVAER